MSKSEISDESKYPEWSIIELQGDLLSRTDDLDLRGHFIGDLHYATDGTPLFLVGHHVLYGKVMEAEKPFLVLRKRRNNDETEFNIQAIVRRKIIFKTRPKPVVTNVPVKR